MVMSGCGQSEKQQTHKEYGKIRKKRDEEDVQKVTKLLLTIVKNPSEVAKRVNEETDNEGQETGRSRNPDAGQDRSGKMKLQIKVREKKSTIKSQQS